MEIMLEQLKKDILLIEEECSAERERTEKEIEVILEDLSTKDNVIQKLTNTTFNIESVTNNLKKSVEALESTVKDINVSFRVFEGRMNLIVGMLAFIGATLAAGVIKLVFFNG
jgi:archaellum component FlaC